MNYIILDLEATCWEKRDNSPNEIIEIGAVYVNEEKIVLGEIDILVKPKIHPQLSAFCTQLTSITQEMVEKAPHFPEALIQFQQWIHGFGSNYLLCSWGHYDKSQLMADCKLHGLDTTWLNNHISLKHQYADIRNTRPMGMKGALKKEGFALDGTHHRGIDDAKNIAKIFVKYFEEWKVK